MEKKMTAKELSREARKAVDKMLMEFVEIYGIESLKYATVRNAFEDEVASSAYELHREGKIATMKERWG